MCRCSLCICCTACTEKCACPKSSNDPNSKMESLLGLGDDKYRFISYFFILILLKTGIADRLAQEILAKEVSSDEDSSSSNTTVDDNLEEPVIE